MLCGIASSHLTSQSSRDRFGSRSRPSPSGSVSSSVRSLSALCVLMPCSRWASPEVYRILDRPSAHRLRGEDQTRVGRAAGRQRRNPEPQPSVAGRAPSPCHGGLVIATLLCGAHARSLLGRATSGRDVRHSTGSGCEASAVPSINVWTLPSGCCTKPMETLSGSLKGCMEPGGVIWPVWLEKAIRADWRLWTSVRARCRSPRRSMRPLRHPRNRGHFRFSPYSDFDSYSGFFIERGATRIVPVPRANTIELTLSPLDSTYVVLHGNAIGTQDVVTATVTGTTTACQVRAQVVL